MLSRNPLLEVHGLSIHVGSRSLSCLLGRLHLRVFHTQGPRNKEQMPMITDTVDNADGNSKDPCSHVGLGSREDFEATTPL